MNTDSRYRYRQPSFFFPIVLITAGVIWLLVNNNAIPVENLYRLAPYWPVLLILAGVSLIFRRIWWPLNGLMWAAAAVALVWLLTTGSGYLPKLNPLELKHETLHEKLGQAASANVQLDLSVNPTTIHALNDSPDLLFADVYSVNGLSLDASGSSRKNVSLHENFGGGNFSFNPRFDQWFEAASQRWDIGLTPEIPLRLGVAAGVAQTSLNLAGLKLESLKVDAGTGRLEISLPESPVGQAGAPMPVQIDMATGGITVHLPANTAVDLNVNGGTGGLLIELPAGAGVQVNLADSGLGGFTLPSGFTKVRGGSDKEGIWQNEAYNGSKTQINITLHMGTGEVTIQ